MSIELLVGTQNRDGGWPYVRGASWTEPTVYAVLALLTAGEMEASRSGLAWLRARQLPDGGWPPQAAFDESTWVTSLAALVPPQHLGAAAHARAIGWLVRSTGEETAPAQRLRQWLMGTPKLPEQEFPGWPWIPGAAAWVGPTSLAILALERECGRKPTPAIRARIEDGRGFLLRRMCKEGGWNHGSVRALGYESDPYPETTGMGLAAMRGVHDPHVARAVRVAHKFLDKCRSADALNWLRLGLLAHGELPAGYCPPSQIAYRTLTERSLDLLVAETQKGRDFFWV